MWTRTIRLRSNLHATVVTRCLKALETKGRVKPVQNSKWPSRKVYILAHLTPSEDLTGGPFYTDGALDEAFVATLARWIERYVTGRSWWDPTRARAAEKGKGVHSRAAAEAVRSDVLESTDPPTRPVPHGPPRSFPPGYTGYPSTGEIARALNESGITGERLKEADVRKLLDVLLWDDRLVRARGGVDRWRSRRPGIEADIRVKREDGEPADAAAEGTGLADTPCGRCPVANLCHEDGPVSARTCPYFQEWLRL